MRYLLLHTKEVPVDAKEERVDDADADQGRAQPLVQPKDLSTRGMCAVVDEHGRAERVVAACGRECARTHRLVLDDGHGTVPGAAVQVGAARVQHAGLQPDLCRRGQTENGAKRGRG